MEFTGILLFAVFTIIRFSSVIADDSFFKDVPLELRCTGCELTVKTLHYMIVNKHGNLESHVDRALDDVCDEKRFHSSEYNPKRMVRVCKYIMKRHGKVMRYELLEHYQHPKRPTYLEFVQHVCLNVLKFCAGVSHSDHKHDPEGDTLLHFDSKTHGFTVKPGNNIKMANPVHELHDEL